MTEINIEELEIMDNINFMIKYCDTFLDYCHNENLSIDGNIAGEIVDSITNIEEYLEHSENSLTKEDLKNIYDELNAIYYGLRNLNDIKIFNTIHIVYSNILNETRDILEKKLDISLNE